MKKKLLYTLLPLLLLGACQKEYDETYDIHPWTQFTIGLDCPPGEKYKVEFEGYTFQCQDGVPMTFRPTVPLSVFGEDSVVSGNLSIYPVDANGFREGEVKVFPVTLKPDTTITLRKAVADEIRLITSPADENQYTKITFIDKYFPDNYRQLFTTFNDEQVKGNRNQPATFHKDHLTGTLRFYLGKNIGNTQIMDRASASLEMTLENYTLDTNAIVKVIRPLGSPMEIYKEENDAQYTTLKASVVYGQPEKVQGFIFSYDGDYMKQDNWIRTDHMNGTLEVFRVAKTDTYDQYDTTSVYTETRTFNPGEKIEFVSDREGNVSLNKYTGTDPSDRASFLVRITVPETYTYFDANYQEQTYSGTYDIKISTARHDEMNGTYTDHKLIHEFKNQKGGEFSEAVEIHTRGDFVPESLYDAKVNSGEALLIYDPETWEDTEEWKQCRGSLVIQVYKAGTDELCYEGKNTPIDMYTIDTDAFQMNEDWTGLFLPPYFTYKCFTFAQSKYNLYVALKQGTWE